MMLIVLIVLAGLILVGIVGHFCASVCTAREMARHPVPGVMVDVHGEKMHVLAQDEGKGPVAVLLSGWSTAVPSTDFQPLARAIHAKGMPTVIVEKFGYGYSDRTCKPRTLDNVIEEMRAALKGAGVKPPYILCGHSLAGTELVRWSCLHPEELAGLVSIDAPAPLAYTHLPLPPAFLCYVQTLLCWCGLDRLLAKLSAKYAHREDVYMNHFQLLSPEELARVRVFQRRNAANPVCLREILALRKNCRIAGGKIPEGIPVTMCIASDTKDQRWDMMQPEECDFIRENNAREVTVKGLHNLQQYDPETLAEEIVALAGKKEEV